jgi:hypothetical protein
MRKVFAAAGGDFYLVSLGLCLGQICSRGAEQYQVRTKAISPHQTQSISWPSPVALSGGLWGNQSRAHGWPSSCTAVLGHYGFQIITVSPSTDP